MRINPIHVYIASSIAQTPVQSKTVRILLSREGEIRPPFKSRVIQPTPEPHETTDSTTGKREWYA